MTLGEIALILDSSDYGQISKEVVQVQITIPSLQKACATPLSSQSSLFPAGKKRPDDVFVEIAEQLVRSEQFAAARTAIEQIMNSERRERQLNKLHNLTHERNAQLLKRRQQH